MSEEKKKSTELNFEDSLVRLEAILEKMNSGKATLDESIKLFEEADRLIVGCNRRLNDAEQKIEKLLKNRQGELILNEKGAPSKEDFEPPVEDRI